MNADERRELFMKELKALLAKHNASIELGVSYCPTEYFYLSVELNSVPNADGEFVDEFIEFDLGNHIDGK